MCSVDEGKFSKTRVTDYMVDPSYIVKEFRKIVEYKGNYDIEAHIDAQGEPTLYPYLNELIRGLASSNGLKVISIQTNGTTLNETKIKELEKAKLNRINLSINSLDFTKAKAIAGIHDYDIEHVKEVARLIVDSDIDLLIAPVWIPGVNDEDIKEIIHFTKNLMEDKNSKSPILGIQNYLEYKFGRIVRKIKKKSMNRFYEELRNMENKFRVKLILSPEDFNIHRSRSLPKPFRKRNVITGKIIAPGRTKTSMIAVVGDRLVQVLSSKPKIGEERRMRIIQDKHNIFSAVL